MIIQHAILHILDMNTGNLIASQGEMAVDNVGVVEYIEKLTAKVSNGDVKTGTLAPGYVKDKLAESDFGMTAPGLELNQMEHENVNVRIFIS